jgi:flagellar hook-associated protein 3 FlgL
VGSGYLFSGFKTGTPAYDAAFDYQGDSGSINVGIGSGVMISQNVTGREAFGYALGAEKSVEIEGGVYAHYIPGSGTSVTVEIRGSDDATVLDSFTYANAMEMADVLTTAMRGDDTRRISACLASIDDMAEHVNTVRADLGARLNRLEDQESRIEDQNLSTATSLSSVEDADIISTASDFTKASTVLSAMRATSSKILSQSLLDFLD